MADNNSNQEDDLSLPRAAVNKVIKETIPNIRVSNDARELILNCCTEFIHLVSSEANEICNKNTKKTISPEHIIEALECLGFNGYISDVQDVLQQFKSKSKKKSHRLENLGIPEEELLRQQQELFQKARMEQAQEEWMLMQQAQAAAGNQVNGPSTSTDGERHGSEPGPSSGPPYFSRNQSTSSSVGSPSCLSTTTGPSVFTHTKTDNFSNSIIADSAFKNNIPPLVPVKSTITTTANNDSGEPIDKKKKMEKTAES